MAVCDYLVNKENGPEHKRISNLRTLMKENIVFLLKIQTRIYCLQIVHCIKQGTLSIKMNHSAVYCIKHCVFCLLK